MRTAPGFGLSDDERGWKIALCPWRLNGAGMCSAAAGGGSGGIMQHLAAAAQKVPLAMNELSCPFKIVPSTSPQCAWSD